MKDAARAQQDKANASASQAAAAQADAAQADVTVISAAPEVAPETQGE